MKVRHLFQAFLLVLALGVLFTAWDSRLAASTSTAPVHSPRPRHTSPRRATDDCEYNDAVTVPPIHFVQDKSFTRAVAEYEAFRRGADPATERVLVYSAGERLELEDQMMAIVSSYVLALVTWRVFLVQDDAHGSLRKLFEAPADLWLDPHGVDLSDARRVLITNPNRGDAPSWHGMLCQAVNGTGGEWGAARAWVVEADRYFVPLFLNNPTLRPAIIERFGALDYINLFRPVMGVLFAPSREVRDAMVRFKSEYFGQTNVCVVAQPRALKHNTAELQACAVTMAPGKREGLRVLVVTPDGERHQGLPGVDWLGNGVDVRYAHPTTMADRVAQALALSDCEHLLVTVPPSPLGELARGLAEEPARAISGQSCFDLLTTQPVFRDWGHAMVEASPCGSLRSFGIGIQEYDP